LADDVGGGAQDLADVVDAAAVGGPHGRAVLAVEGGQAVVVAAGSGADPDVVAGGAAVALAVPGAGAADVGGPAPPRRVDALAALGGADAAGPAALGGDGVQLEVGREAGAALGGEQDVLAVGRPAGGEVVGGVEGEPARLAAADGDDEDVVGAVA